MPIVIVKALSVVGPAYEERRHRFWCGGRRENCEGLRRSIGSDRASVVKVVVDATESRERGCQSEAFQLITARISECRIGRRSR